MTANAFDEDRRACVDAGMNDHVAKPVDPDSLFMALIHWMPRRTTVVEGSPSGTAGRDQEEELLRQLGLVEGLDLDFGLARVRGKFSTYTRLLTIFAATHQDEAERITAALDCADMDEAQRAAHSLKGSAGSLGLLHIQKIAAAIEAPLKARADNALALARLPLAELARELPALMSRLQQLLGS